MSEVQKTKATCKINKSAFINSVSEIPSSNHPVIPVPWYDGMFRVRGCVSTVHVISRFGDPSRHFCLAAPFYVKRYRNAITANKPSIRETNSKSASACLQDMLWSPLGPDQAWNSLKLVPQRVNPARSPAQVYAALHYLLLADPALVLLVVVNLSLRG